VGIPLVQRPRDARRAGDALSPDGIDYQEKIGYSGRGLRAATFCRSLPAQLRVLQVLRAAAELDPRALAAASAAFVRSEMAHRSSSAIIAMMPTVSRFAFGMSAVVKANARALQPE
jgi:hypothetical protein